mgnify:CR=1 FL=1
MVSVDDTTNKITAKGIGHVEIEILNGENPLFTFSAEVVDDIEQHVVNAEKIYIDGNNLKQFAKTPRKKSESKFMPD